MSDRTECGRCGTGFGRGALVRPIAGALATAAFVAAVAADFRPVRAASVFMKNGYIIQGQVVERDEETVVLGWPNGKVYLARRFIETVAYEPGEEKRLEDEERARREQASASEGDEVLVVSVESNELPSTLEELLRTVNATRQSPGTGTAGSPVRPGEAPEAPGAPGSAGQPPEVPAAPPEGTDAGPGVVVTRPEDPLGEAYADPVRGLSLRPPRGWDVRADEKALAVRGPEGPNGFRPSVNVVAFDRGPLDVLEYVAFLKQENAAYFEAYEPIYEGECEVGAKRGFQLVGRATRQGKTAVVRQILVGDGTRAWLLSTFTEEAGPGDGSFSLLEGCLKTLEFRTP